MRGYRLLEREAEDVLRCVKYGTEEEVVRRLIHHQQEAREMCTIIVEDGSTALHALAMMPRPQILQVRFAPTPHITAGEVWLILDTAGNLPQILNCSID